MPPRRPSPGSRVSRGSAARRSPRPAATGPATGRAGAATRRAPSRRAAPSRDSAAGAHHRGRTRASAAGPGGPDGRRPYVQATWAGGGTARARLRTLREVRRRGGADVGSAPRSTTCIAASSADAAPPSTPTSCPSIASLRFHQPELLRVGKPARPVDVDRHLLGHLAGQPLVEGLARELTGGGDLVVVERVGPVRGRVAGVERVGVGWARQRLGRLQLHRSAQVGGLRLVLVVALCHGDRVPSAHFVAGSGPPGRRRGLPPAPAR